MNPTTINHYRPSEKPSLDDRSAFTAAVKQLRFEAARERAARNRGGIFWDDVRYSSAEDFAAAHGLIVSDPFRSSSIAPDGFRPRLKQYGDAGLFINREFFRDTELRPACIALHVSRRIYFDQREFILRLSSTLMATATACRSWYRRGFMAVLIVRRDGPSMGLHRQDGDATPIHDQKGTVKLPGTQSGRFRVSPFIANDPHLQVNRSQLNTISVDLAQVNNESGDKKEVLG